LHDFRVSVRRTRSGLSQLKNIFDQEITLKAKQDFLYLGQATNKMRDIDVYLLKKCKYREMLPAPLRTNLDPLFASLSQERKKEHQSLVKLLCSNEYKRILQNWEDFIKIEDATGNTEFRDIRPIIDVAREVIRKRNQRVVKFGKDIIQNSSDELLHKLRIEAKKLRYLLEFFSSLFPQKQIQELILKLKQLQDNLGEFNDLVVQQNSLRIFSESLPLKRGFERDTILAVGVLMGKLHEKEQSVKKSIAKKFELFIDRNIQRKFRQLFGSSERGVR
jgi:CHAD domain-containing protein